MSAVILRNELVHYEVLGRGRPIIFLHDWVGSWRYWIPVMQAASISYRTYALDLWGFGDSAKNTSFYTLESQVSLIDEFLDSLGIGRIALVGHGLGAVIAMLYARDHPLVVDRIMAIGYPLSSSTINGRLQTSSPAELAEWLLGRSEISEPARADAPKADPKAIALALNDTQQIALHILPVTLSTPFLLVHGQDDAAIEAPRPDQVTLLPEQAHAIIFEQSGHFPMLDEPNKFNRLLADFLSLQSGESPRQLQLKEEWKRRVR